MRSILLIAFLTVFAVPAQAQDMPNILTMPSGEALLHISATEQMEVTQDLLVTQVRYEMEDADSTKIQDTINKKMQKALDMVNAHSDIKAETQHYNIFKTTVARTKEQIWRGSQGLELKSTNAEKLLTLSGELQELGFMISGLNYTISPARAADLQDNMMEAALAKLQTRAERAAKALGKSSAELVEVDVQGGGMPMPVSMYRGVHMEMAAMKSDSVAPPVASAGETTLSLSVSAKAVLKP